MKGDLLQTLSPDLIAMPGVIFHTGWGAFTPSARLYVLGLNPSGNPETEKSTIADDIARQEERQPDWSDFLDSSWKGKTPGQNYFQKRMKYLADALGFDLRHTPASNLVFKCSPGDSYFRKWEWEQLIALCWPFHKLIIENCRVNIIICYHAKTAMIVRESIGAVIELPSYTQEIGLKWKSRAWSDGDGRVVFHVSHPSKANWTNPKLDPTGWMIETIERHVG